MKGHEVSHYENEYDPEEFITQDDICEVIKNIHIGDSITFKSGCSYTSIPSEQSTKNISIHGRVIAKYKDFFVVESDLGVRESIKWVDLIIKRKQREKEK